MVGTIATGGSKPSPLPCSLFSFGVHGCERTHQYNGSCNRRRLRSRMASTQLDGVPWFCHVNHLWEHSSKTLDPAP